MAKNTIWAFVAFTMVLSLSNTILASKDSLFDMDDLEALSQDNALIFQKMFENYLAGLDAMVGNVEFEKDHKRLKEDEIPGFQQGKQGLENYKKEQQDEGSIKK